MSSNINFNKLWKQQHINAPGLGELISRINILKRTTLRKLIFLNSVLIITAASILCIVYYFNPQLMTTKVGVMLILLAIISYLMAFNKLVPTLKAVDYEQSNKEYLQNLIQIKTNQQFMQTTMLNAYFIFLTVGICLYLYEYTLKMPLFWAIFSYVATLSWLAFNWFYIRPKTIKKQQQKLDELIGGLIKINEQFLQ